ncbi:uncharacterized protein Dere_GG14882, isoform C [Drosophila erecta]|uniref:Uncharacterized protein, isoform C n=1 Tax=Drosophila erecta TaxID=7220 RepID=A0A0Q5UH74_DROER|nr:uncharacterized protein Dere_GG14882, isoform C [Drosophila erecta]
MPAVDVDTALLTMGYGFGQVIIFMVSFFVYMYSVTESMTAGYLVVLTSCEFDTSHEEKTLLANSLLGGMVASGLFIGFLADRYGRKFVIRLALVGALCFSMISAFMPELYSLSVARPLGGCILAGGIPGGVPRRQVATNYCGHLQPIAGTSADLLSTGGHGYSALQLACGPQQLLEFTGLAIPDDDIHDSRLVGPGRYLSGAGDSAFSCVHQ